MQAVINQLVQLEAIRKGLTTQLNLLTKEVDALKLVVQQFLEEEGLPEMGPVSIRHKEQVQVKDWLEFRRFILDTGNLELLESRPHRSAIAELMQTGNSVPGVGLVDIYTLHINAEN